MNSKVAARSVNKLPECGNEECKAVIPRSAFKMTGVAGPWDQWPLVALHLEQGKELRFERDLELIFRRCLLRCDGEPAGLDPATASDPHC